MNRFRLSRRNRWIFGLFGGLGEYFGVDPALFRALYVFLTVTSGEKMLAYIAAYFVVALLVGYEGSR